MTNVSVNNKKILKNAVFLYFRMFIMMAVSLYTSRVVLATLGIEDFGIYNVVAGVVILFSFINTAMQSASQRYLTFALGKQNLKEINKVFSMSLTAHIVIALFVLLLSETIGLFFLLKMNFPESRISAIMWTYQLAIFTCVVQIIRVPYNASIIAYERMSFYAWISLVEVLLKLGIVFCLYVLRGDKLILYSSLLLLVSLIIWLIYKLYCSHCFTAIYYNFFWDKKLFTKFLSFSGWTLFGSLASVSSSQGLNFIINIFCGVTVNAAVGIGNQVTGAITQFLSNFQTAFNPQLIKSYAVGDRANFVGLLFKSARYSYFLMLLIALPVIFNCDFLLDFWLDTVPDYAVEFSQVMIVGILFESISGPLWISVQATGKIKVYQVLMSLLLFLNLPVALIIMYVGLSPVYIFVVKTSICFVALLVRIIYLKKLENISVLAFVKEVLSVLFTVTLLALPLPYLMSQRFENTWGNFTLETSVCIGITSILIYLIGLTKHERKLLNEFVNAKIKTMLSCKN